MTQGRLWGLTLMVGLALGLSARVGQAQQCTPHLTAERGGRFVVTVDGDSVSAHNQEREAAETAIGIKLDSLSAEVRYNHAAYNVAVTASCTGEPPAPDTVRLPGDTVRDTVYVSPEDTVAPDTTPEAPTTLTGWRDGLRAALSYAGDSAEVVSSPSAGMRRFVDQTWTVDSIPNGFDESLYVRTSYQDHTDTAPDPFVSFTLPDSAAVYLVDLRDGPPAALDTVEWAYTGLQASHERRMWKREFGPGEAVQVPPNAGEPGMYALIVLPAAFREIPGVYPGEGVSVDVQPDSIQFAVGDTVSLCPPNCQE